MKRYFIPVLIFFLLSIVLAIGLQLNPRHIPSPLIDKPAPSFSLPRLDAPNIIITPKNLEGKVWALNVWASWCTGCLEEHPLLIELLQHEVDLVGLNYKDNIEEAQRWLSRWGNPYAFSLTDNAGVTGINWGVYGVPETFIIDKNGRIRHKHIGVLRRHDIEETLLPLIRQLQNNTHNTVE